MIRDEIGNTVVRFFHDKATAMKVADIIKMSVLEYEKSNRFIIADKAGGDEIYDEAGLIFNVKSLKKSDSYKQDFQTLMTNSTFIS